MRIIKATELKNRLGEALAQVVLGPVGVERHGRVVAYLVPPTWRQVRRNRPKPISVRRPWGRREEERIIDLCVRGDFRPSRWLCAGNPRTLAGISVMLASQEGFDRTRMLALAEQLHSRMSTTAEFGRWLAQSPVQAARFLPMLKARMRARELLSTTDHPRGG